MVTRKCPNCGRVGQVRVERIFKATDHRTSFSCSTCGASWTTTHRPDRKPAKRKHTWMA